MSEKRFKVEVEKVAVYTGHKDCLYTLGYLESKQTFFSSGADGLVVGWEVENPDLGKVVAQVKNTVYTICTLPNTDFILVGQNFEGIHLIDLTKNAITKSTKISEAAIFDIKVWDNKIFVATGDGTLVVLNLTDFTTLARIKDSTEYARALAVNKKSKEIAVGYSDNCIRIYDTDTFQLKRTWVAHKNSVFTLSFTPDYTYLLSGSRDAHLNSWDAENAYTPHDSIVAHMYTINHIAFNKSGKFFATCSKDKSIKIWDAKTFRLIKVIDKARHAGHGTSVNKLFWSDENTLFSCSDDHSISKWKLEFNVRGE